MSTFTLFPKLPKELRDMIWDEAIRDDVPSAHFFTMYDTKHDQDVQQDFKVRATATAEEASAIYRVGLAAPYPGTNSNCQLHSWVDGNLSAYMADSGLWQACWESARRMEWRFQWHTEPVTMTFQRERGDNGESHYLTIRPSEDLLCLQFNIRSRIDVHRGYHWQYLLGFPPFRWQLGGGWWDSTGAVRHIAVQFDPAWRVFTNRWPAIDELLKGWRNVVGVAGLAHFWLVSYTMERRYRAEEDRAGRQIFRACGGLEFVEVLDGDDEWWDHAGQQITRTSGGLELVEILDGDEEWLDLPGGHDEFTPAGPKLSPAKCVAKILQTEIWEMSMMAPELYYGDWVEFDDDDDSEKVWLPVGVLACVKHGSEKHLPTKSQWMDARRQKVDTDGKSKA